MQTLADLFALLPETHLPTVLVSVVSIVVLILAKELNNALRQKLLVPIPVELCTVCNIMFVLSVKILCHKTCHFLRFVTGRCYKWLALTVCIINLKSQRFLCLHHAVLYNNY